MPQRFDEIFWKVVLNLDSSYRYRYSRAKVVKLSANMYFFTLADALMRINAYLKEKNLRGRIVCDDHEMSKGFSATESIDWLQQNKLYEHLAKPAFANGTDESLLQVSDILCYVTGQVSFAMHTKSELKEPLMRWAKEYIFAAIMDEKDFFCDVDLRHISPIVFDLLIEQCVYDEVVKDLFKRAFRELYKNSL